MASEGERVPPVFMVTFDFCLICWSLGRCSFHLDSMALLGFRTKHFGCSNSYSYFSQLCWAWQFSLADCASLSLTPPTSSLLGRMRFSRSGHVSALVPKNCFAVTAGEPPYSLSGTPFNRLHSRICNIVKSSLYHTEAKDGPGKARSLWCQAMAMTEIKPAFVSACFKPLFCLVFSFPIIPYVISSYH